MLTELDAVNKILSAAGLAPVADANSQHPSYRTAKMTLDAVSSDIQSQGAWYNKSTIVLQPTVDGNVYIPQTATYCSPVDEDDSALVIRGARLYDKSTRSYSIGRSVTVDLIEVLPFNDLPEPARQYVTKRAVYEHFVNKGGQDPKLSEYKNQLAQALLFYNRENLRNSKPQQDSFQRRVPTLGIRH